MDSIDGVVWARPGKASNVMRENSVAAFAMCFMVKLFRG